MNEYCTTYSRVTLSQSDTTETKRLVLKNELKFECECLPPDQRTALSKDLCV